jgi:GNAT superfamily N-acetyltransferase
VGAAWYRFLPAHDPGYGFVPELPELTVGVVPPWRGRGVGRLLVAGLLEEARASGLPGVSLSVEPDNVAALALYRSLGFEEVGGTGGALTLVVPLDREAH